MSSLGSQRTQFQRTGALKYNEMRRKQRTKKKSHTDWLYGQCMECYIKTCGDGRQYNGLPIIEYWGHSNDAHWF